MNEKFTSAKGRGSGSGTVSAVVGAQTILVPTDFSPASREAMRQAREIALSSGATLLVLHVVKPMHVDWHFDTTDIQTKATEEARRQLNEWVASEASSVKAKALLRPGEPVEVITHLAETAAADLIVIATQGCTGLKKRLIGSVAERVVCYAPCPVLVIRPKKRPRAK